MQCRPKTSSLLTDQRHAHFTGVAEFGQFDQSVSKDSQDLGKVAAEEAIRWLGS